MQKSYKNKNITKAVTMATAALTVGISGIALMQNASAIGTNPTYVDTSLSNTVFKIDSSAKTAEFAWGKYGNTSIQIERGNKVGNIFDLQTWFSSDGHQFGATNQPSKNSAIYSLNKGDSYRIKNVGKTSDGEMVDIIYTINASSGTGSASLIDADKNKKGIAFSDSADMGINNRKNIHSISMMLIGYNNVNANVKYVKAGTNTPLNLTTATAWYDIDRAEGINENQSNSKAVFKRNQPSFDPLNIDNRTVYATYQMFNDGSQNDVNGYDDADSKGGTYLGFGTGTNFDMSIYSPYTPKNNTDPSQWPIMRFDFFGIFNNFKLKGKINVNYVDQNNTTIAPSTTSMGYQDDVASLWNSNTQNSLSAQHYKLVSVDAPSSFDKNNNQLKYTILPQTVTYKYEKINAPTKKVTDETNKDINGKETSMKNHWIFNVAQRLYNTTDSRYKTSSFSISDKIQDSAEIRNVHIYNEKGTQVDNLFDLKQNSNYVSATMKDLSNMSNYNHTYNLKIDTIPNINTQNITSKITNTATSNVNNIPFTSNTVTTSAKHIEGSATKSIARAGSNVWNQNLLLDSYKDLYQYKITYNLSNHSKFRYIVLTDEVENIQNFNGYEITQNGKDISNQFNIYGQPTEANAKSGQKGISYFNIEAKHPEDFERSESPITVTLKNVTLKNGGYNNVKKYLESDNLIHVYNTATLNWDDFNHGTKQVYYSNKTNLSVKRAIGTINVAYVDQNGNKLKDNDTLTGYVDDPTDTYNKTKQTDLKNAHYKLVNVTAPSTFNKITNGLNYTEDSQTVTYQYEKIAVPTKTVTDENNNDINGKTTTMNNWWIFNVSQKLYNLKDATYKSDGFTISDTIQGSASIHDVHVYNEKGTEVDNLFNLKQDGNYVSASLKELTNLANYNHTYTLRIGTRTNITTQNIKSEIANQGNSNVDDLPQVSNTVTTNAKHIEPAAKKEISLDGKNWSNNLELHNINSKYDYRLTYTLSNHTTYADLVLSDELADVQNFDDIQITRGGKDATDQFEISGKPTKVGANDGKKATTTLTIKAKDPLSFERKDDQVVVTLKGVTLKNSNTNDLLQYNGDNNTIHVFNTASLNWTEFSSGNKTQVKSNTTDLSMKHYKLNQISYDMVHDQNKNNPLQTKSYDKFPGETYTLTPDKYIIKNNKKYLSYDNKSATGTMPESDKNVYFAFAQPTMTVKGAKFVVDTNKLKNKLPFKLMINEDDTPYQIGLTGSEAFKNVQLRIVVKNPDTNKVVYSKIVSYSDMYTTENLTNWAKNKDANSASRGFYVDGDLDTTGIADKYAKGATIPFNAQVQIVTNSDLTEINGAENSETNPSNGYSTYGYTASEKVLTNSDLSSSNVSGKNAYYRQGTYIAPQRTLKSGDGTPQVFNETITYGLTPNFSIKSGYGFKEDFNVKYNGLHIWTLDNAKKLDYAKTNIPIKSQLSNQLVQNISNVDALYTKNSDGTYSGSSLTHNDQTTQVDTPNNVQVDSVLTKTVNGQFANAYVSKGTNDNVSYNSKVGDNTVEGGNKFYVPVWITLGNQTMDESYGSDDSTRFGQNYITINVKKNINVYANMYLQAKDGSDKLDELAVEPVFNTTKVKNFTDSENKWISNVK